MQSSAKVLVMGDDTRSFLACVRSLGRQGIEVHAAPYTLEAPALASRYIQRVHLLPYYLGDGHEWLAAMQALLQKERFDMVLPCEERSLLPLFEHRDALPPGTRLAIPDERGLKAFFDKWATRELALQAAVPVAKGVLLQDLDTPEDLLRRVQLPLVAKHRQSYSVNNLYRRTQVQMLRTRADLERWWHNTADRQDLFMEEVFAGMGAGVSVLSREGQVLMAFEHHRATELEGSSYYRKSMPVAPQRLEAVERMCMATGYSGLAMFEFKLAPTGEWILLEVNARPWGSLPLPVACGVDFPYALFRMLCRNEVPASVHYPSPRYARNLVADVWQLRLWMGRHKRHPVAVARHALHWLWSLRRLLSGEETLDVSVPDDRQPARVEWQQFFRMRWQTLRPETGLPRLPKKLTLQRAWHHAEKPMILFLCQGNICRSPYAEHKARAMLDAALLPVNVASAGLLPRTGRPSPMAALEAARQRGVNLADHRSQHAHPEVLEAATWIVVFDNINRRALHARHPHLAERVILLGRHAEPSRREIADPDGQDTAVFLQTYQLIDDCLVRFLTTLPLARVGNTHA